MEPFDIIHHPLRGTTLIEASAGTGKTYTIAGLYLRLVLEQGMAPADILVVTFTRAATEELRDRIRKRLREALRACRDGVPPGNGDRLLGHVAKQYGGDHEAVKNLSGAIRDFDEAAIYTIHSFCQRVLRENAFESSSLFTTELAKDSTGVTGEIVDDFWRPRFYEMPLFMVRYYREQRNITEKNFGDLLKKYIPDPAFTVVPDPEPVTQEEIGNAFSTLTAAHEKLNAVWSNRGEDIRNLLLTCDGLNRNSYRITSLQKWFEEMNSFLTSEDVLSTPESFERFRNETLQEKTKKGHEAPEDKYFDLCSEYVELLGEVTAMMDIYLVHLRKQFFTWFDMELAKRKAERSTRSFDDIIADMYHALRGSGGPDLARAVGTRFSAALIDEFQDTDPLQYNIFTGIFKNKNHVLFLIGDPKQAIYGFRSADIFAYLKAKREVDTQATLVENWRSTPELVAGFNAVFSAREKPFVFEEIDFTPAIAAKKDITGLTVEGEEDTASLRIWLPERNPENAAHRAGKGDFGAMSARASAAEISHLIAMGRRGEALIEGRGLLPKDIAVLARKNRQALMVQRELTALGVPSVLYGSESLFRSREAEEVERLMAAVLEPGNGNRVRLACATGLFGMNGGQIHNAAGDDAAWEELTERFYRYHELWMNYGFARMFRAILMREHVRERILRFFDGERRMTNYLHCAEVISRAETERGPGMEGILTWFADRRIEGDAGDEHQLRLETDENAVTIVTVHSSKGLEYPVVFCPFLYDGVKVDKDFFRFHEPPDYRLVLDVGSGKEEHKAHAAREDLAENVRLMYVALTRAQYRCYLSWGIINESGTSGPFYLFHGADGAGDADTAIAALNDAIKNMDYDTMLHDLRGIVRNSGGNVSLGIMDDAGGVACAREHEEGGRLSCREFRGAIVRNRGIVSYSSLVKGHGDGSAAADHEGYDSSTVAVKEADTARDIFSFPRGADAGNCIHWIFEHADFTGTDMSLNDDVIVQGLRRYGFPESWSGALSRMVTAVLDAPLGDQGPGPRLRDAGRDDRLHEMEFMVPLEALTPGALRDILPPPGASAVTEDMREAFRSVTFSEVKGYLRGFIDLIFRHEGRYYIVDWKSNHLGNSVEAYSRERMMQEMKRHNYYLQYYIYTAALHRYLTLRQPGYRYADHFGGVRYVFVRGVSGSGDTGIFRDCPPEDSIVRLSDAMSVFSGGNE